MKKDLKAGNGKSVKKEFLEKIKVPFNLALLLTLFQSIAAVCSLIAGVINGSWRGEDASRFVSSAIFGFSVICIFVSMIKIIIDEKPFSNTLVMCLRIIAVVHVIGSVVLPVCPGYESAFEFLAIFDGNVLSRGVWLYILSVMIKEGFSMQTELEEVL